MARKSGAARRKSRRERERLAGTTPIGATDRGDVTTDDLTADAEPDDGTDCAARSAGERGKAAPETSPDATTGTQVAPPGDGVGGPNGPRKSGLADHLVREMKPRPRGVEPLPPPRPVEFPDPEPYVPYSPRPVGQERGDSNLTRRTEARMHARAVLKGWATTEFPIHKTAAELEAERHARGGHLTLAEELAVANVFAAKTLPNLAPLAARAGAMMVATNARIEAERAKATALDAAAEVMASGNVEAALDLAEEALFRQGYAGDRHALETFLRARGRARGYVDRREVVSANLDVLGDTAQDLMERLGLSPASPPSIESRLSAGVPNVLDGGDPADYRPARRAEFADHLVRETEPDDAP